MEIIPTPVVVFAQVFPFLVTLVGLWFILFKPMLAYLDGRSAMIMGERQKAAEIEAQLTARMNEYQARLTAARAEVVDLRSTRREAAVSEYNAIVARARREAEGRLADAVRDLSVQREAARESLERSSGALGEQLAAQVLGRDLAVG